MPSPKKSTRDSTKKKQPSKSGSSVSSHPWLEIPPPTTRSLQIYAFDPSVGGYVGNRMTVKIPWEPLELGSVGSKIAVVDYDGAMDCYYSPVNLDDPYLLANDGLDPSESDPRFH